MTHLVLTSFPDILAQYINRASYTSDHYWNVKKSPPTDFAGFWNLVRLLTAVDGKETEDKDGNGTEDEGASKPKLWAIKN